MQVPESSEQDADPHHTPQRPQTRILLVDFRSGEAVESHPEIVPFLEDGWVVRSAEPRLVEAEGPRLLVCLVQARAPAIPAGRGPVAGT